MALLDINMPKMNGFELYKEIRKIDDKVKVCFVTAFDIQREEEDDLKAEERQMMKNPPLSENQLQ